jgi:riboflavin biosynthesis pyrimidine reductase
VKNKLYWYNYCLADNPKLDAHFNGINPVRTVIDKSGK